MEIRDDDNWEVAPAEIMKLKRSVKNLNKIFFVIVIVCIIYTKKKLR